MEMVVTNLVNDIDNWLDVRYFVVIGISNRGE